MKKIQLIGYTAQLKEELQLHLGTDGSYGIEQLQIEPGTGWEALVITATFHSPGGAAVQMLVPEDGVLDVPPEATDMAGRVARGSIVFSGTAEGVQRISCDLPYWVAIHSGVEGDESRQPTPDFVQQALSEIRAACDSVEQAEQRIAQMEGSVPIRLSQLSNDCGFVTRAVTDLEQYYRKSETFTRAEVQALVSAVPKFKVEVVDTLPTEAIAADVIYLVPGGQNGQDLYAEYLYVNGRWELLGTQQLELAGCATTEWVNTRLQDFQPAGDYVLRSQLPELSQGAVQSVNGKQGAVVLSAQDVGALSADGSAADAAKLGGQMPDHYAAAAALDDEIERAKAVEQDLETGKLDKTEQAADAAKLDGKTPDHYAAAAALNEEVGRAKEAEQANADALNEEVGRAKEAEQTNAAAAAAAKAAAEAAQSAAAAAQTAADTAQSKADAALPAASAGSFLRIVSFDASTGTLTTAQGVG